VTSAIADPGSFRDPSGTVFQSDGKIYRTVAAAAAAAFQAARESGLIEALVERGMLLPATDADGRALGAQAAGAALVLEHPRLPFVSYPYEWGFAAHRRAALLHLDLHLAALERGFTLSDATAYNVQFIGARPVFIDHLSLRPYRDGEIWAGHRQFCMQFLNPLLLRARRGVAANAWFRGALEGIEPEALAPMLSTRDKLSWTVLSHVTLQASLQRRAGRQDAAATRRLKSTRLPLTSFKGMLAGLRTAIARLRPAGAPTTWGDYTSTHSYSDADMEVKRRFVAEMVAKVKPKQLWDIGCNTGDFSALALKSGAGYVVGFDFDHDALDKGFARAEAEKLPFQALWLDAANPSPDQGWAQHERRGLQARAEADALLALALVHHIAIGRNVPLERAIGWLIGLAPTGIIEFPPRSDPMVERLLALREDIFQGFTEEAFLAAISARARVVRSEATSAGRRLVWYDRG
jgi:ribosomal protein L11 methylase PrmA